MKHGGGSVMLFIVEKTDFENRYHKEEGFCFDVLSFLLYLTIIQTCNENAIFHYMIRFFFALNFFVIGSVQNV